jgi:hypothetical protein
VSLKNRIQFNLFKVILQPVLCPWIIASISIFMIIGIFENILPTGFCTSFICICKKNYVEILSKLSCAFWHFLICVDLATAFTLQLWLDDCIRSPFPGYASTLTASTELEHPWSSTYLGSHKGLD